MQELPLAAPPGKRREGNEVCGPPDPPHTRRLVDSYLANDPDAERELCELVRSVVVAELKRKRLWSRRLRRRYEREDVVGEMWRRLLQGRVLERYQWQRTGSLAAEIRKILDNQLCDMNRRLSADKRGGGEEPRSLDGNSPETPRAPEPQARDRTPSVQAWTAEAREWVRGQLDGVTLAVFERWLQDRPKREIAPDLGLSGYEVGQAIQRIQKLYLRYRDR